ncbi:transcription cofactor vestigial-like protein 3 [Trematomus bernacchii]|uniref:transcription cofactor vestigial-like protein 3 n=1 Tax=Trematomus bernacchii TaxID=40690 RepID=UPI00146A37E2|nr:transcription cofactor vestigial-like protein 3 [Trematomus bernacchii]
MSCLDVMYHQSYGAHFHPAAAYKATYYNHHHQQQQRRLSVYSKRQECMEQQQQQGGGRAMLSRDQGLRQGLAAPGTESIRRSMSDSELKDGPQPAEAEYLSSRCVLFTYFQGDIGDVVDEHFSRALSQSSTFNSETKPIRVTQPSATGGLWKDGGSLSEGQSSSVWNSTYPSQASPCLPSVSVSVHPDFSSSPVSFNHPDAALWADHVLSQAGLPPPATLPESWTYSLNPQSQSGYPNVHNVYHPHPHIHTRHHHPMLHPYPTHSPALDPRFNPLLLPAVRNQNQPSTSTASSPHSEGVKTEMQPSSSSPVPATSVTWSPSSLHGSLEGYDSALDQTKAKSSVWF